MNQKRIRKGMILAAGLGTRLLPITERYPKPLVPILNTPNILHSIYFLKKHGITDIIINLFHLPERMEEFFNDSACEGVTLSFSKEKTLLGTGGGVKKAEAFFQGEPFVLVNCDFVTNASLTPVIDEHFKRDSWATMVLLEDPVRMKRYSPVGVDEKSRLCSLPKRQVRASVRQGVFTGIHVLNSSIFQFLEEKPSGINEVLYPRLMEEFPDKTYGTFADKAYWYDTGDIPAFWEASMELLEKFSSTQFGLQATLQWAGKTYEQLRPGVWSTEKSLPVHAKVQGPVLLGSNCMIEEGATIGPRAILGEGCVIGQNALIKDSVILPQGSVPPDSNIQNALFYEKMVLSAKPSA